MIPHFRKPFRFTLAAFLLAGLAACATSPLPKTAGLPASLLSESSDLQDVRRIAVQLARQAGQDQVLLVYDLDNTLLAMEQDLGSDQWYYWQKELQAADRCDPRVVTDLLAAQGALFFASAMRPTQENGASVVRELQDDGFNSIILTSRGPGFAASTLRELRRNGLDFSRRAVGDRNTLQFLPSPGGRETRYESGVYLTAGQDKGEMLLALLQATGTPLPAAIVMADDKQENLQDVLDALAGLPVSVQALRYNREDTRVAAFDGATAAAQWQQLEPALLQLQAVLGPDNFHLPQPVAPEGCPVHQP